MKNGLYHLHITAVIVLLLLVGLLLRYWIGKRRFNRRNVAGLQEFKNFYTALLTLWVERIINIIAVLMISAAVFLYLIK